MNSEYDIVSPTDHYMDEDETNIKTAETILAFMSDVLNLEIAKVEVGWELCMWDDDQVGRVVLTSTDGMLFFSQVFSDKIIKHMKVKSPLTYETLNEAMATMAFGLKAKRIKGT